MLIQSSIMSCRVSFLFLVIAMLVGTISLSSPRVALAITVETQDETTTDTYGAKYETEPQYRFGGGFGYASPTGPFQDFVEHGFGFAGFGEYRLDPHGIFSLRGSLGILQYGSETIKTPLISGRIMADITTSNNILWMGFGPRLAWNAGAVRPYGDVGIGFSYFYTESDIKGSNNNESFAESTNFDDTTFAWHVGGGLQIPITGGETPISIYLSSQYIGNGDLRYLNEGSIQDQPDGSITFEPIESEGNLMLYQVGVLVGGW